MGEKSIKTPRKPVLQLESQLSIRSSTDVVVAQVEEQLCLTGDGEDMVLQESEERDPVKQCEKTIGRY